MFECLVDPRCSYEDLLDITKGPDKYDHPNVIFWDHSRALFLDDRGLVPDNRLSLLSRWVTFGHYIHLLERNTRVFENGRKDPDEFDNLFHVPYIDDNASPDIIRKPRYIWRSAKKHPKVLVDTFTQRRCYFHPSLNQIRVLGPDFDFNPLNYLEDLEKDNDPMAAMCPMM